MDARQCRSKSGSVPPSARPEAFDQSYGSANYNVQ